jgi:hypothetical protein
MSFAAISGALGFVGQSSGLIPPLRRLLEYSYNEAFPNEILDPQSAAILRWREEITDSNFEWYARQAGFDKSESEYYFKLFRQMLSPQDVIALVRRGKLDAVEGTDYLRQLGYTPEDVDKLVEITKYFPNPGDLVRFAVREVYSPDIASTYGLTEDMPQKFIEESFKAGLDEDQAKNFWAAHWELPSLTMGYEIFHRGIITEDELFTLMRTLDIMPFWRERLRDLSYNPLTRVDVRRMYGLGVLDRDAVLQSYLNIGYSPENAELMTQFTERYENQDLDGISRASLISAFKKGIISYEELETYLEELYTSESVVQYWLANAEYEKTVEILDKYKNDLISAYRRGAATETDIQNELNAAGVSSAYLNDVMEEIARNKASKRKIPSKSDLEKWLQQSIISEEDYSGYMKEMGYDEKTIANYLTYFNFTGGAGKVKYLEPTIYVNWAFQGIISESLARERLEHMGILKEEIDALFTK